jgi:hypothetical protein
MALALIPIEKLQSGIVIIITNQLSAKQIDFVKYFVRQWCNAKRSKQCPAIWNQHMAVRITNNVLEGYHSIMTSCMRRVHPSVSEVIEFFKNRLSVSSDKFLKLKQNFVLSPSKKPTKKQFDFDLRIELTHQEYFNDLKDKSKDSDKVFENYFLKLTHLITGNYESIDEEVHEPKSDDYKDSKMRFKDNDFRKSTKSICKSQFSIKDERKKSFNSKAN